MISSILDKIKRAAQRAGLLYLCLTAVLMLLGESMATGDLYYFNYDVVMRMIVFSLIFGVTSLLLDIRSWNKAISTSLHLILNLVSYYRFILKPLPEITPMRIFVQLSVFILVYLVFFFLWQLTKWIVKRAGGREAA